jgi:hypothetical protein
MRRPVVHDEKQPLRPVVRLVLQHLIDQVPKRLDPRLLLTSAHDHATMHIPCCQVLQGSVAFILRFDSPKLLGFRRQSIMFSSACLNARLFIQGQHIIFGPQRSVLGVTRLPLSLFGGDFTQPSQTERWRRTELPARARCGTLCSRPSDRSYARPADAAGRWLRPVSTACLPAPFGP